MESVLTGQLVDTPTHGLPTHGVVSSWTEQVADWTAQQLVKSWTSQLVY